ncbi:DUF4123 domain-containing protein [Vibrio kanaloae]|uniref:DUF4123 domain-containing protein n=1 Tax=Vibrio kanaloae TaxID=170673 RepID=UPI000C855AC5|nr:DUF4123 domain-containing protein [Vibrio kanaloae]
MSNSHMINQWRIETGAPSLKGDANDIYMLIEPELWPNWKVQLYQEVREPFYRHLFDKTPFAHIEQGPILVAVSQQSLFHRAIENLQTSPCGCLLYVKKDAHPDTLLRILRERLIAMRGSSTALLRYYEPRTLTPLLGTMSNEERSCFFQHIEQVYWYQERWHFITIEAIASPPKHYQWIITPEHISTMQSILQAQSGAVS